MRKKRILVIEDNMDSYQLVQIIFEKNGYETFLAMNGRDGVSAALKQTPDLIIMDLAMPLMDGWTAAELIKQDEHTANIPMIALTARVSAADRQRAFQAGCDDYIVKPINIAKLVKCVKHWLDD
jgi:CheY-like chemotaxis protein